MIKAIEACYQYVIMDVFSLSERLVGAYEGFSRSFVAIRSQEIRKRVDEGYGGRRFWPQPLLQINPHYRSGRSVPNAKHYFQPLRQNENLPYLAHHRRAVFIA